MFFFYSLLQNKDKTNILKFRLRNFYDPTEMKYAEVAKFLGIYVNEKLQWNQHFSF